MAGNERLTADGSNWFRQQRSESAFECGYSVLETLQAFAEPTDETSGWVRGDDATLAAALTFEGNLRYFGLPNGGSDEVVDGLHEFVDRWHGALPFDEQERIAVYGLHLKSTNNVLADDTDVPTLPELLEDTELELMSGGVRRTVLGSELLWRWWEWRRGVGEFEGQDTYEEATKALGLMAARLLPRSDLDLFDVYFAVMGEEPPADSLRLSS